MSSLTKKFLSAIIASAIVFSNASATVSAANSSTWGTSSASTSTESTTSTKDFGNSSYWNAKDKYGYAYPYSYYCYANDKTNKQIYIAVYEALHDRKASLTISKKADDYFSKTTGTSVSTLIINLTCDCPELYYYKSEDVTRKDNKVKYEFTYMSEKNIAAYEKTFAKTLKEFDLYLSKNNVKTTEQFINSTLSFVGSRMTYDSNGKNIRSIIGAFVDGKVVCAGYVEAFNYLCRNYGISYSYKSYENIDNESGHALSAVPCNNVWYNFDPTAYNKDYKQWTTETQVKNYGYKKATFFHDSSIFVPNCNGKASKPPSAKKSSSSTNSNSTTTSSTTASQSNIKEITLTDYFYEDSSRLYPKFNNDMMEWYKEQGYTKLKATVPDGKLDFTIKYLQDMKKSGDTNYTSLAKGKNYVLITL